MNENPIFSIRDHMVENKEEITDLWKTIATILDNHNLATQFAAISILVSEIEFSQQGPSIVFDSFLAFSRHICNKMKEDDMARN